MSARSCIISLRWSKPGRIAFITANGFAAERGNRCIHGFYAALPVRHHPLKVLQRLLHGGRPQVRILLYDQGLASYDKGGYLSTATRPRASSRSRRCPRKPGPSIVVRKAPCRVVRCSKRRPLKRGRYEDVTPLSVRKLPLRLDKETEVTYGLWSGRFTENVSEFTQRFGASLPVDKALYVQDIAGSKAHAKMLAKVGVISEEDAQQIAAGLDRVKADIESGDFSFDINDEDIHMSVEKALTAEIGDAGARLHTGRSRNDQVATDTRLYAKQRATDLMRANVALRHALIGQAEANFGVILPGYTHLQHAQPVLFSHHMLAYVWMLARDYRRLQAARDAADACPLGAAALRLGQRIRLIGR